MKDNNIIDLYQIQALNNEIHFILKCPWHININRSYLFTLSTLVCVARDLNIMVKAKTKTRNSINY